MYEYTHKAMSYAHSPKKLSYMLMLWAMLIYELCSCHELCPYHKLCLKYDQWPCHNRIIHPIRDDRRLKNWCFFGKGPKGGGVVNANPNQPGRGQPPPPLNGQCPFKNVFFIWTPSLSPQLRTFLDALNVIKTLPPTCWRPCTVCTYTKTP